MPALYAHADSLREYLTGAGSDGGAQSDPNLSLGNYRSSTEAVSLGILLINALTNVTVLYAGGANPPGPGTLTALDANTLVWQPHGASGPGPAASFSGMGVYGVVEAAGAPGQYLRVQVTTPLTPGVCTVVLSTLMDNCFGLDDISIAEAAAGESAYRASMIRNESSGTVLNLQRCLSLLGTAQVSDSDHLGGSGSGMINTSGSFGDWPETGWCQVRSSGGALKEVVYYSAKTNTQLTVSSVGRGLLGTSPTAGLSTDTVSPTPGVAIGVDPLGIQNFGMAIQTVANENTAPVGVTWNLELTAALGLQIGDMAVNKEVGVWIWRQVPAGILATPSMLTKFQSFFSAL